MYNKLTMKMPDREVCVKSIEKLPHLKIGVTGEKGIGKSTALRKVLEKFSQKPLGFVTKPIKERDAFRGFEIVDLFDGASHPIAYFDEKNSIHPILEGFETVGVSALSHALKYGDVILMDELGFLENDAMNFKNMVFKVLESDKLVFCVIKAERNDFLETVSNKMDRIFTIDRENRDKIPDSIWRFICSPKTS
jgi:nucleoside-triphosphatase